MLLPIYYVTGYRLSLFISIIPTNKTVCENKCDDLKGMITMKCIQRCHRPSSIIIIVITVYRRRRRRCCIVNVVAGSGWTAMGRARACSASICNILKVNYVTYNKLRGALYWQKIKFVIIVIWSRWYIEWLKLYIILLYHFSVQNREKHIVQDNLLCFD